MPSIKERLATLSIKVYSSIAKLSNDEYESYMNYPAVLNRPGFRSFQDFYFFAKLYLIQRAPHFLTSADKLKLQNELTKKLEFAHCSSQLNRNTIFSSFLNSYYKTTSQEDQNKNKALENSMTSELDQIEHFYFQFLQDLKLIKRLKRMLDYLLSSLLDNSLSQGLLNDVINLDERVNQLKERSSNPVEYLKLPDVKNKRGYQEYLTLSEITHKKKRLIDRYIKLSLGASEQNITINDVVNIFPENSLYRRYIELTQSWWGFIKSYIPFTEAFTINMKLKNQKDNAKDFIEEANDDINKNSTDELIRRNSSQRIYHSNASILLATSTVRRDLKASGSSPRTAADKAQSVRDALEAEKSHIAKLRDQSATRHKNSNKENAISRLTDNKEKVYSVVSVSPSASTDSSPDEKLNNTIGRLSPFSQSVSV